MLAMGCVDASCSILSSADVAGVLHKEVSFFLVNILILIEINNW